MKTVTEESRRWANFHREVYLNDTMIEVETTAKAYYKIRFFVIGTIILLAAAATAVGFGLFDKYL